MKTQDELKKIAGYKAAELVEDGMTVGLGTGSTVRYLLDALGERIKKDGVHFTGVPTSKRTADYGRNLGMEIKSLDDVDQIDITIDGADEVDPAINGIKGGGGAQTWEKLVATNSKQCAWIVDESKVVDQLGKFPLPVEVLSYGHHQLVKRFEEMGYNPVVREKDGQLFKTDEGNIIVDLHLDKIAAPYDLADQLSNMTGVVEHGLFLDMTQTVVVGTQDGAVVKTK
ncbi:ribose-5-phosphate isomerase A [Secundilactobacillus odoratitofui DSM 19909 = JCM 15043]|uniref:Ribose-5-phosphate isomerase A n=1 Tax=Secundilactobacillus odoratitofui DSM 19909 = JCM 15043 TaxID=1423776 RepID=A0A0R1LS63_9LACO|nr:ribose-5-phosphate isomerase RpiA [Secundilactobacillus odoratitofui]KRK98661.1 ribose-5-phosphate isomerase A [Secundilactobacillus odoratitofui DSM 19909 = JCM 15043]